jgi:hypothetical protein
MPLLSVSAAARAVGKSRVTLHRYLKDGRLGSVIDDTGMAKIDTGELLRVFGEFKTNGTVNEAVKKIPIDTTEQLLNVEAFKMLKEQLQSAQERERAAQERESWLKDQLENALGRNKELELRILALPEGGTAKKPGLLARLLGSKS